ncbi:hypothetical protein [Clostridium yunnanense]|nr:hypothetical protein [Clostridium yunnanense]
MKYHVLIDVQLIIFRVDSSIGKSTSKYDKYVVIIEVGLNGMGLLE